MSDAVGAPPSGLTSRTVKAGTLVASLMAVDHVMLMVRTLVLSRMLQPVEFGLMGMAIIVITMVQVLSQTGFHRALVQRREVPEQHLHTVFSISVARGLALFGLVFAIAPAVGSFFRTPAVTPVVRAASVIIILHGLVSPRWYLLERDLRVLRFALPKLAAASVDLVVTTALAFSLRSVWAMVLGFLAGGLVEMIATHIVAPYSPRLIVHWGRASELYAFGKHVFRHELLANLTDSGDRLVVARLCDATSLGLYTVASRLVTLPTQAVTNLALRVVFPSFSLIQSEPARVRDAFLRLLGLTALASFPLAALMLAAAPELVSVVLGAPWTPMTTTFQILCGLCVLKSLEQLSAAIGSAIGRPAVAVHAAWLKLAILAAAIIPATSAFGTEGAAAAVGFSAAVATGFLLWKVNRLVGATTGQCAGLLAVPAIMSLTPILIAPSIRQAAAGAPTPILLVLLVSVGATAYTAATLAIDRLRGAPLLQLVLGIARALRAGGPTASTPARERPR